MPFARASPLRSLPARLLPRGSSALPCRHFGADRGRANRRAVPIFWGRAMDEVQLVSRGWGLWADLRPSSWARFGAVVTRLPNAGGRGGSTQFSLRLCGQFAGSPRQFDLSSCFGGAAAFGRRLKRISLI